MKKVVGCSEWGRELCRAFGEDPKDVSTIDLHSGPNEAVTVTIRKYINDGNKRILKTIKKVIWTEDKG
jgi:hypothetical protein